MRKPIVWMLFFLVSIPGIISVCRSGFESLGILVKHAEDQMKQILDLSADVCKPGCNSFQSLICCLQDDITDLREAEYKFIDVFLESNCSYDNATVVIGQSDDFIKVINESGMNTLPFTNIFGVDYDAREDRLVFTNLTHASTTGIDGSAPQIIASGSTLFRPTILSGDTVYILDFDEGIMKVSGNTTETIVSGAFKFDLAVDPIEGYIYWVDIGTATSILTLNRATLSGANVEGFLSDPRGFYLVAIDAFARQLYYNSFAPSVLVVYDLRTETSMDLTPVDSSLTDISVCGDRIYLSYAEFPNSRYEVRDRDGNLLQVDNGFGDNDFMTIATCNLVP